MEAHWKISYLKYFYDIWDKTFKNGPSEICGRQPLKNLKCRQTMSLTSIFLKDTFHRFHLVPS